MLTQQHSYLNGDVKSSYMLVKIFDRKKSVTFFFWINAGHSSFQMISNKHNKDHIFTPSRYGLSSCSTTYILQGLKSPTTVSSVLLGLS